MTSQPIITARPVSAHSRAYMATLVQAVSASLIAAAMGTASTAHASSYLLHQGGFAEGSEVSIAFNGTDLNQDGFISSWDDELTGATLNFSGTSQVAAFSSNVLPKTELGLKVRERAGVGLPSEDPDVFVYFTRINAPVGAPGTMSFNHYDAGTVIDHFNGVVGLVREPSPLDEMPSRSSVGWQSFMPITITAVPEPTNWLLMTLGLAGVAVGVQRRQAKHP